MMAGIISSSQALPQIPSNMSLTQFMLDYQHEIRPPQGNTPCLIDNKTRATYTLEELKILTDGVANSLYHRYSLGENDTTMLLSPNTIYYPITLWAIYRLGGIVVPSNPQFTEHELVHQLSLSRTTFIITHSSLFDLACSAAQIVGLDLRRIILMDSRSGSSKVPLGLPNIPDLTTEGQKIKRTFTERIYGIDEGKRRVALLCWSSGTTGKPKAVAISHYAIIANIIQMAVHSGVGRNDSKAYMPGDVGLANLPFFHVAGLVVALHSMLFFAMTVVVVEKHDLHDMLKSIAFYSVTHLLLVPPQAIQLCKQQDIVRKYDLSRIKVVRIGAAPVSENVQNQLYKLFPTAGVGQIYGLTEMTATLSMLSAKQIRGPLGSTGQLLPGIQAKVIKADGTLANYGESGELVVKGPSAALGYFRDERATRETFTDGWVHTGDKVHITKEHEIYVFDRLKEMIKVKGMQVAPAELEGCLLGHPDVVDSCVVGVADYYFGELPFAFVVLSPDALARMSRDNSAGSKIRTSIAKHVAGQKTGYKHLKGGIEFIDSIPKNGSGKLLRRVLRGRAKDLVIRASSNEETVGSKL